MGGKECAVRIHEEFRRLNSSNANDNNNDGGGGPAKSYVSSDDEDFANRNCGGMNTSECVSGKSVDTVVERAEFISTATDTSTVAVSSDGANLHSGSSANALFTYVPPVIVACTGYNPALVAEECAACGIARVEQKPISAANMRAIINDCFAQLLKR